jgi:guanine deaminase
LKNNSEKMKRLFRGAIVHSKSFNKLEVIPNGVLAVNTQGNIEFIKTSQQFEQDNIDVSQYEQVQLTKSQLLIPGFVDIHTHAPQVIYNDLLLIYVLLTLL